MNEENRKLGEQCETRVTPGLTAKADGAVRKANSVGEIGRIKRGRKKMSMEQRHVVNDVNRSQMTQLAPDVTELTREYLAKCDSRTGMPEVARNLLLTAENENNQPEARKQARRDLKRSWSEVPEVAAYFAYLQKLEDARLRRDRIHELRRVFKDVVKVEEPKTLTAVEQQAASRRHDSHKEKIRNLLAVVRSGKPTDDFNVEKFRAEQELLKYRNHPEVDAYFINKNVGSIAATATASASHRGQR